MAPQSTAGSFRNGVPFHRLGEGPRTLLALQGLQFEHKAPTGFWARLMLFPFNYLKQPYTAYVVTRRPGLPEGYSMGDMAADHAGNIREELAGPVDVLGTSTGGSIALHLAADHPELVRRLVIHSSAHTLGEAAKETQLRTAHLAGQGKWREASSELLGFAFSGSRYGRVIAPIASFMMALTAPEDPSDLIVTVEAEDKHAFKDRLGEISAPTLVIAGDRDPFYSEALFLETAEGIPDGRLILYPGMGHPASGKEFQRDVLAFLEAGET
jgi:pimeloyl-ACP methyl ester carboxylesterase